MSIEVKIPALGESISSGILSSWKVADGSYVEIDQPIYELETDKITQEGLAEATGVITFLSKEGDEVEIGSAIARIDDTAEKPAGDAEPAEKNEKIAETDAREETRSSPSVVEPRELEAPSPPPVAEDAKSPDSVATHSPAVRKKMAESGIDPSSLSGSGKDGRLTKADVLAASKERVAAPAPSPAPAAAHTQPAPLASTGKQVDGRSTRRPLSPIRRKIASRLVEAQQNAAILSTFNEVDLSAVMALRKRHQDSFVKHNGVKLGFMSFFVKAVVHGLQAVPELSVRIEGSDLVENHYFGVGVAVGTEKGLVVPVLRDCEKLSFAEIEQGIVGYAEKRGRRNYSRGHARGLLHHHQWGDLRIDAFDPILNPPQSGILGMHAIEERAVVRNGEIVIRPMMYLALSYDHRVVDGKEAVTFLVKVKEAIEEPARLALGI